jgi:hypothetical protein
MRSQCRNVDDWNLLFLVHNHAVVCSIDLKPIYSPRLFSPACSVQARCLFVQLLSSLLQILLALRGRKVVCVDGALSRR